MLNHELIQRTCRVLPLLLFAAWSCSATQALEQDTQQSPPAPLNVLLIIADDQGYADMGCTGLAEDVETPNMDRLAARGLRFTHAYATSPICNASRAGLMTGCYQQRFGTFWYGGKGMHDAAFPTLAEVLRDAGYATGYVGKFHYGGGPATKPGNRSFPLEHGYADFFGFAGGRKHYLIHEQAAEKEFMATKREHKRKGQSLAKGAMWQGEELVDQQGLSTELFGARARDWLDEHQDAPFFLTLAFNAVHNFTHQLPPEYLAEHGLAGYHDWDPATEDYYDWYRAGRYPNNPEGRAQYLGQLHFLDVELGRVLDHLQELGLADNTLIIYIGDNGGSTPIYANNGPLRGSKYTLYEGGVRVPLILSLPGRISAGATRDQIISAMDVFPTVCALTGLALPTHLDGHDLAPILTEDLEGFGHETLVWDTKHETAVRQGRWKLKTGTADNHAQHEMVELELGAFLYDLEADPGERSDVSAAHPEVFEELKSVHRRWRAALQ